MKSAESVPADIAATIDRVYRRLDNDFVKSRNMPSGRWLPIVERVAGQFVIREQTDFNYGRAYVYDIYLSQDARARVASAEVKKNLLGDIGDVELVRLSVSTLAPYYMLTFGRYCLVNGKPDAPFSLISMSESQRRIEGALDQEMAAAGLRRLDPDLAEAIVPDVATELRPVGTATVSDLLIGPY